MRIWMGFVGGPLTDMGTYPERAATAFADAEVVLDDATTSGDVLTVDADEVWR